MQDINVRSIPNRRELRLFRSELDYKFEMIRKYSLKYSNATTKQDRFSNATTKQDKKQN